jgi:pimeloyl-ACP methyl ester carboxylesterase
MQEQGASEDRAETGALPGSQVATPVPDRGAGNGVRLPVGMRLVAGGLRVTSYLAPGLAGAIAEALYFRALGARPRSTVETGVPFELTVQKRTVTGFTLGEGDTVLMLHGWRGTAGDMVTIAEAVAAAGMRAVAIDLPGHGDDRGARTDLFIISAAIHAVGARFGPPTGIVAHSFGAAATFGAFPHGGPRRVALFAPAIRGERYLEGFGRHLGLNDRAMARFTRRVERFAGPQMMAIVRGEADVPGAEILIQHDPADAWTSFADAERFAEEHSSARIVTVAGAGHKGILRNPEAVARAVEFLAGA